MQRGTDTCITPQVLLPLAVVLPWTQSIRLLQGALLQVLQDQQEGSSVLYE